MRRPKRLLSSVWAGFLVAALAAASGIGAAGAAADPPIPQPLAVVHYLEAQRAGFGSPSHAAALAAHAMMRAQAIRAQSARPASRVAGVPSAPSGSSFTGAWSALGPTPVTNSFYGSTNTGRVDSVAVMPSGTHKGEIFIGTAGGGVWSSSDGGTTWQTHTDNVSTGLAIGALAIDPVNPETIYAGTGEANNCGDCFYGGGVLKSTDGGNTWTIDNPSGVFTGVDFASIAVDPKEHLTVFAGTSKGFFVSKDGGSTWAHPTGTGLTKPTYGIALDPTSASTTVYVATEGVGVQKSIDGGQTFVPLSIGLLPTEFGVTELGIGTSSVAHSKANETLYAAVQLEGSTGPGGGDLKMFKSTNGGVTWSEVKAIPAYTNQSYAYGSGSEDQASYDNAIAVDPTNPEHVIAEGIAIVETTNGGGTWENVNRHAFFTVTNETNVIHPDFHAVTFASATQVIIGCDGGVYEYDPVTGPGAGVKSLNTNEDTTQLYADLSIYNDGEKILGGLQDNGTAFFTGSNEWPDELSGDGGYNAINPLEPARQFGEADERLYTTSNEWATSTEMSVGAGNEGVNGNFVPPMTIVPNTGKPGEPTVFYGGQDLWVTRDPAAGSPSWSKVTTTGEGEGTAVSAIAISPSDAEVMYVGFDDGALLVSKNATSVSPTFTSISPGIAQWITHIAVNPAEPSSIALSFSSSNTQSAAIPPMVETGSVVLSGTPSATYTNITGNLPAGVASNSVVFDRGALVVATDVGAFSTTVPNGASTVWGAAGTGLPNVQVLGLSVDENGTLYAATHGRGVWTLPTKAQTIEFTSAAPSNATVGGAAYTVTAAASSGLPVALSVDAASTSVCALSGSSVSFSGVGTCTIDANQAGSGIYEPAPQAQQSFTVAKAPETTQQQTTGSSGGSPITSPPAASGPLANQAASQTRTPPRGKLRVVSSERGRRPGTLTLRVEVPGPGALSVIDPTSGHSRKKGGKHAKRKAAPTLVGRVGMRVTKAGVVNLVLSLTRAGESRLKRDRRLSVKILIAFTSTGGARETVSRTVVFRAGRAARRRKRK